MSLLALTIGLVVGGVIALFGAFAEPWLVAWTDQDQWRPERPACRKVEILALFAESGGVNTFPAIRI